MDEQINNATELLEELGTQLAESMYKTIQVLSTIVNLVERYYEGSHSRYVADKSAKICEALGMDDSDIFVIRTAALLHDIGKVGLKESILYRKMNELSESELKQYMLHPELGMQILSKHPGLSEISEIVYQHHEKIDGNGFPRHLRKGDIHPGASIISVVNYFHDALYKRNRDQRVAVKPSAQIAVSMTDNDSNKEVYISTMNYLHSKKGILFEKKVVDIFTELVEAERRNFGSKTILRVPINQLENGMIFARDYYTSYGLLIASKGESVNEDMKKALIRFAESDQIPMKLLVIK